MKTTNNVASTINKCNCRRGQWGSNLASEASKKYIAELYRIPSPFQIFCHWVLHWGWQDEEGGKGEDNQPPCYHTWITSVDCWTRFHWLRLTRSGKSIVSLLMTVPGVPLTLSTYRVKDLFLVQWHGVLLVIKPSLRSRMMYSISDIISLLRWEHVTNILITISQYVVNYNLCCNPNRKVFGGTNFYASYVPFDCTI
jgi:hypothetical protein